MVKNSSKLVQKWFKIDQKGSKNELIREKSGPKMVLNGPKMVQKWFKNEPLLEYVSKKCFLKLTQNGSNVVQKSPLLTNMVACPKPFSWFPIQYP